jgi:hypothetical protein
MQLKFKPNWSACSGDFFFKNSFIFVVLRELLPFISTSLNHLFPGKIVPSLVKIVQVVLEKKWEMQVADV